MQNNEENQRKNTMRTAEETGKLAYFSQVKKTSAQLSLTAFLTAFFGKPIKFKKSTRETSVALIN